MKVNFELKNLPRLEGRKTMPSLYVSCPVFGHRLICMADVIG